MPSSLSLLHTAMPTPCMNAFWHSHLFTFCRNVFVLFLQFFLDHLSFLKPDNSMQPFQAANSPRFSRLLHKQLQKSTPDGEKRSLQVFLKAAVFEGVGL